jgi:hypothetical protein
MKKIFSLCQPNGSPSNSIEVSNIQSNSLNTFDPFISANYYVENYPFGDDHMRLPTKGDGYRLYHGVDIPGFPRHPHRGFETITATVQGFVDHADSFGNSGRYGEGDMQWLVAGKGIVHSEMFPLIHDQKPNPLKVFQIGLNLPTKSRDVEPETETVSLFAICICLFNFLSSSFGQKTFIDVLLAMAKPE